MPKYEPVVKPKDEPKPENSYVTIPKKNVLGWEHPNININDATFYSGDTYFLPTPLAEEIERILHQYQDAMVALIQGRFDLEAVIAMARAKKRGEAGRGLGDNVLSPNDVKTLDQVPGAISIGRVSA